MRPLIIRTLIAVVVAMGLSSAQALCGVSMNATDEDEMNYALDCARDGNTYEIIVMGQIMTMNTFHVVDTSYVSIKSSQHAPGSILWAQGYSSDRVFNISHSHVEINNLLIAGSINGGAIQLYGANLTATGVTLSPLGSSTLVSQLLGGGIYASDGSNVVLTLSNISNWNANQGGAVWLLQSHITVSESTFHLNAVTDSGGSIYFSEGSGGNVSTSVVFSNNIAAANGGAVYAGVDRDLAISQTSFINCTAVAGSALYIAGSADTGRREVRIIDSLFIENVAGDAGTVYVETQANAVNVINVTCSHNLAMGNGGCFVVEKGSTLNASLLTVNRNIALSDTIGGAVSIRRGSFTCSHCQFLSNTGTSGGAISNVGGLLWVYDNVFRDNTATYGGAVYSVGGVPVSDVYSSFSGCDFHMNSASSYGGAIFVAESSLFMTHSYFYRNSAFGASDTRGGMLYSTNSVVELDNLIIIDSSAGDGGGLMLTHQSRANISTCEIRNATASNNGGAIRIDYYSDITITNTSFYHSQSGVNGGHLYIVNNAFVHIYDSILSNSFAYNTGSAMYASNKVQAVISRTNVSVGTSMTSGGCLHADGSVIYVSDSSFDTCVSSSGGVASIQSSAFNSINCSYYNNKASEGGVFMADTNTVISLYDDRLVGNIADYKGGCCTISAATLYASGCLFSNSLSKYGGAIYASVGSSVNLHDCNISNNKANYEGGGLLLQSCVHSTINSTVIAANEANTGGGIYLGDTYLIMNGTTMQQNAAVEAGGAAAVQEESVLDVTGCVFTANSGFLGAAFSVDFSFFYAANSKFTYNSAVSSGIVNTLEEYDIDITITQDGYGGVFSAFIGYMVLHYCSFQSNSAYSGGVVSMQLSYFNTRNVEFIRNTASIGGCVTMQDNNMWLSENDVFEQNIAYTSATIAYGSLFGVIDISDGVFKNPHVGYGGIPSFNLYVGYLYLSRCSFSVIDVVDTTFQNRMGNFYLEQVTFDISDSEFTGLFASLGGAVYIANDCNGVINGSTFSQCTAEYRGGALAFSNVADITIFNCTFNSNVALAGGAVDVDLSVIDIQQSVFKYNTASLGGGGLFWKSSNVTETDLVYYGNSASYGPHHASYPTKLRIANAEDFTGHQSSGYPLTSPVNIVALDYFDQVMSIQNTLQENEVIVVTTADSDSSISGSTLQNMNFSGVTVFSDLTVTYQPDSNVTLEFSVQGSDTVVNAELVLVFRPCEVGEVRNSISTTQAVCVACKYGFYSFDPTNTECKECPENAVCHGGSSMDVKKGYWRQCQYCNDIKQCQFKLACHGGENVSTQCRDGHEGPLCNVCSDGYFKSDRGSCDACNAGASYIDMMFAIFIAILLLGLFYGWRKREWIKEKLEELAIKVDETIEKYELRVYLTKMKILVAFVQILVNIPQVLAVVFPKTFSVFINSLSLVNLSFLSIFATDCYVHQNFYTSLLFSTVAPPFAVFLVGAILQLRYSLALRANSSRPTYTRKQRLNDRKVFFLVIAFFVFSPVSITIFQTFVCERFEDGKAYLVADSSVRCYTHEHNMYMIYASVMILIYPLGIPLFYTYHLTRYQKYINPATELVVRDDEKDIVSDAVIEEEKIKLRETYEKVQSISFLYDSYVPKCWYFEIIECFRRLTLTAIPVLFLRSTVLQIVIVLLVSLGFSALYMELRPFVNESDNTVAIISQWSISITVLGALCMRVDATDEALSSSSAIGVILALMNGLIIALTVYLTVINDDDPIGDVASKVKSVEKDDELKVADIEVDSDDEDTDAVQRDLEATGGKKSKRRKSDQVTSLREYQRRVSIKKQLLDSKEERQEEGLEMRPGDSPSDETQQAIDSSTIARRRLSHKPEPATETSLYTGPTSSRRRSLQPTSVHNPMTPPEDSPLSMIDAPLNARRRASQKSFAATETPTPAGSISSRRRSLQATSVHNPITPEICERPSVVEELTLYHRSPESSSCPPSNSANIQCQEQSLKSYSDTFGAEKIPSDTANTGNLSGFGFNNSRRYEKDSDDEVDSDDD